MKRDQRIDLITPFVYGRELGGEHADDGWEGGGGCFESKLRVVGTRGQRARFRLARGRVKAGDDMVRRRGGRSGWPRAGVSSERLRAARRSLKEDKVKIKYYRRSNN
jgi:hypothetical protein